MVVLKVTGDLIINEGITLTACKSAKEFGGPKGMLVYCEGKVTNHGIISMNARGAKETGENVYLWENLDGSFEYVPAIGGLGASGVGSGANGLDSTAGEQRRTGGGRIRRS